MSVTEETVKKRAKLSKLKLTDDEVQKYSTQLTKILKHMESINELDTTGIEPMLHGCIDVREFRKDEAVQFVTESLLNSAIHIKENYFSVPNIISKSE